MKLIGPLTSIIAGFNCASKVKAKEKGFTRRAGMKQSRASAGMSRGHLMPDRTRAE